MIDFDFVKFIKSVEHVGAERASLELARDLFLVTHKAGSAQRKPRREARHG